MKILNFKKPFIITICLLIFFLGAGAVYSIAKEKTGIIKFLNGPTPSITNAFIDKEKYFPGDIMNITAETKDASAVKALVENEVGFNTVPLVVMASFNGKETWTGKWKVENSQEGKKYKIKIIASNKSGTSETILEWEDPNPGHPWSQIDGFPADCPAGQYVSAIDNGACSTPSVSATFECNDVSGIAGVNGYAQCAAMGADWVCVARGGGNSCGSNNYWTLCCRVN